MTATRIEPRLRVAREIVDSLVTQPQAQQSKIDHQDRSADDTERQQVHGLDDRERPRRLANRGPERRGFTPLKKR
jgi:hypothetical protein